MMFQELKNIKSGKKELKDFSIVIGIVLLFLGIFLYYKDINSFDVVIYISIAFFILGQIGRIFLKPIYFLWMVFAIIIGWFMTRIVLTVLFFGIVSPIGLMLRLFSNNNDRKLDSEKQSSYWNFRDSQTELKQDFEKQF